jgi:phage baseplate assembly protein W
MTELPHFAAPFRLTTAGAAVDEQDSLQEVQACVMNAVACPQGYRLDLPAFGIPDPLFQTVPIDTEQIRQAVSRYEPRPDIQVTDTPSRDDPSQRTVTINVQVPQ